MGEVDDGADHHVQERDVLRLDVGAQLPRVARPSKEADAAQLEALARLCDALEAAGGADDQLLESPIAGLQLKDGLEVPDETAPRVRVRDRSVEELGEMVDALLEPARRPADRGRRRARPRHALRPLGDRSLVRKSAAPISRHLSFLHSRR
jgi:hypothetical protein